MYPPNYPQQQQPAAPAAAAAPAPAPAPMAPAVAAAPAPPMAPAAPPVMAAPAPAAAPAIAAPAAAPAQPADPLTEVLTQLNARLQAIESTLAKLAQDPGNAPHEVEQRRQASDFDRESNEQRRQAQEHNERAAAYLAQASALAAGTTDVGVHNEPQGGDDASMDDAKKPTVEQLQEFAGAEEQKRDACMASAQELAAQAAVLRAKAYGVYPIIQATAALITDSQAAIGKLVTDMGAKLDSLPTKLLTDKKSGGQGAAPGQGSQVQAAATPTHMQAVAAQQRAADAVRAQPGVVRVSPEPERRTLAAAADMSHDARGFVEKYGEVDDAKHTLKPFTVAQFAAAADNAHLSLQQRIAMQVELSAHGMLRKA